VATLNLFTEGKMKVIFNHDLDKEIIARMHPDFQDSFVGNFHNFMRFKSYIVLGVVLNHKNIFF
jgi:hypothetical protein